MDGSVNESALVRTLYDDLRDGDEGIDLPGFLKPFYFLQHNSFTLLDAKSVFDVIKGNFKPQINLREYGTALAKIAKLFYLSNPKTLARLLGDIDQHRKKLKVDTFMEATESIGYDTLRMKLMKPTPLGVLNAYSNIITQSFAMYCKSSPCSDDNRMTEEGFYDFLVGYFISPDHLSPEDATIIMDKVIEMHGTSNQYKGYIAHSIDFPQFLEGICRVAQLLHGKLLESEEGNIRRNIETSRLEHSLKVMFDHMQVLPNGAKQISASTMPQKQVETQLESVMDAIQAQMATLSMKSRKIFQARIDRKEDFTKKKSHAKVHTVDVIVIRDVLAIPEFPSNIIAKIQVCLGYQNNGQYELALSQLHEAEDTMVETSPFHVLDNNAQLFFLLTRGNILDSRQRDIDALQTYSEALSIAESLPESHPGRALTLSCLGSVCYYSGNFLVALKCFDRAVSLREALYGDEHIDTATSLNNLACCFYALGEVDTAILYFRSVLSIFKKGFSISHPRVSVAMKNLEIAQRHQHKLIPDHAHVKNREDMKHIIPGSKFQIKAFERQSIVFKPKKKKLIKKKK